MMHRREFVQSVVAVPLTPSLTDVIQTSKSENQWNVKGVWRRRDDVGHLITSGTQTKFEGYDDWHSAVIQSLYDADGEHISYLFDFRLISVYNGSSCRSHFTHDKTGLEVTLRRNNGEEVDYSAVVRCVDETFDEKRVYHSRFIHRLKSKIARERDEYL